MKKTCKTSTALYFGITLAFILNAIGSFSLFAEVSNDVSSKFEIGIPSIGATIDQHQLQFVAENADSPFHSIPLTTEETKDREIEEQDSANCTGCFDLPDPFTSVKSSFTKPMDNLLSIAHPKLYLLYHQMKLYC